MDSPRDYLRWLIEDECWSRAALCCGVAMLVILPLLLTETSHDMVLLISLLPVYMIHQYEEHGNGAFLRFFNDAIGHGFPALTPPAIFWTNVGGVWGVFVIAFYLARFGSLGFAFIPIYLVLLNGLIHIVTTARLRIYNPGLYTGLLLFLPWGLFALIYFEHEVSHWLLFNAIGLLVAIGEHLIIAIYAIRRRRRLESTIGTQPSVLLQE